MSEVTLTLIRFGFLALLWVFVIIALGVIRSDLVGARVDSNRAQRKMARAEAAQAKASRPKKSKATPTSLTITEGPQAGFSVPLAQQPIVIGRGPACQIRIDDEYSSTQHARVFLADGQWWVEDLGSTNGTYLNGHRLTNPGHAQTGGQIRIGRTTMTLGR